MLRLLLDEHLSPRLVRQFLAKSSTGRIASVLEWQDGRLAGAADEVVLAEAHQGGLTLVTYDQKTIAPLLRSWGEQAIAHGGVVFINDRTIRQNDFGGIVRALLELWESEKNAEWENRVIYLTRSAAE